MATTKTGRLAVRLAGAVGTAGLLLTSGGTALAATSPGSTYGNPVVICSITVSNGTITVFATGFVPGAPYTVTSPVGTASGTSGNGGVSQTFPTTLPPGTVITATVSYPVPGSTSPATCTTSIVIGGGSTPGTGPAPGGGATTAVSPVVFSRPPVSVLGTSTTRRAVVAKKPAQVLGESVTRPASGVAPADAAGAPAGQASGTAPLAFTGSDQIVSGTIVGGSLIAGGLAFVVASRKRTRRRHRLA